MGLDAKKKCSIYFYLNERAMSIQPRYCTLKLSVINNSIASDGVDE